MRARKRWKEAISSIDKLLLCVSPVSPLFTLSCTVVLFDLQWCWPACRNQMRWRWKEKNKTKTQMSYWHRGQQEIKAIWQKNETALVQQRTIKLRRHKDGNQRLERKKGMNECSVQRHQGHWQLFAGVLNLLNVNKCLPCVLICFCCYFVFVFFPSPLHSISTQLLTWIEEGGDGRVVGQWAHSSTLCRQEAMQILCCSLNPRAAQTCSV